MALRVRRRHTSVENALEPGAWRAQRRNLDVRYGTSRRSGRSVFLQTANGQFDKAHNKFGNSLVRLHFDGNQIHVPDFFAPCSTDFMNGRDMDLGSAAPLFLPANLILGGGKSECCT